MQIEFYLPLPMIHDPIAIMIIYYMAGLVVSATYTLWHCNQPRYAFAHERFGFKSMAVVMIDALIFPLLVLVYWNQRRYQ